MVMNHGAEAHTMYAVAFHYFRTKIRKHKSTFTTLNMPQVHPSAEQNLSYNFENLHHTRAVKSSTVVIFEDIKHVVFKSPRQNFRW